MPTQAELLAIADKVLVKNYRQQPIVLERGRGCEVWDLAGARYLDMTAGIAVCGLGHAHPTFTARVAEQLARLVHVSNLYFNDQQILAAKAIVERSFASRVFFCNSGGEANEGAMKLARRYQAVVAEAPHRVTFISTHGSFHGRTFATVGITGQPKYREGFGPGIGPVEFITYGDLAAAERALAGPDGKPTACAIIVEPIQAEGGIVVAPPGYLAGLRALCDATGTLLIFDEVQTGIGRTGAWFGYQHDDVAPDVMTLAKGLGGGVPIGAVACSEKAAAGLAALPGGAVPHASTFGGNALACAAANAVFDILEREGLIERVAQAGQYLGGQLEQLVDVFPGHVLEARGRGLLRGIAVAGAPTDVVAACRQKGLLLSVAGANVVRFAPPYVVERAHLDEAVGILKGVLASGAGAKK
ncbi:MAG: acetylornithine/succinylornithine family transaminase [Deltaproteobacteria bacterium]|nr:acetylornithine/succinylornithine family transaminase [Deltaproteobacteria bacterium]MCW5808441.1 acetylornithine/succinylornithine family transaminase [Deltaproteobacteria bacterium]